jgi:hypothetical protein
VRTRPSGVVASEDGHIETISLSVAVLEEEEGNGVGGRSDTLRDDEVAGAAGKASSISPISSLAFPFPEGGGEGSEGSGGGPTSSERRPASISDRAGSAGSLAFDDLLDVRRCLRDELIEGSVFNDTVLSTRRLAKSDLEAEVRGLTRFKKLLRMED